MKTKLTTSAAIPNGMFSSAGRGHYGLAQQRDRGSATVCGRYGSAKLRDRDSAL